MLRYPKMQQIPTSRQTIDIFGGYNHNIRIAENEFYDMKNMTGDDYPLISARKRMVFAETASRVKGVLTRNGPMCYLDGDTLVYGRDTYTLPHSDEDQTMVAMGSYILLFPAKYYVNTTTGKQGSMEESAFGGSFCVCDKDGNDREVHIGETAPENPEIGDLWYMPTSNQYMEILYEYVKIGTNNPQWMAATTTYTKLKSGNDPGEKSLSEVFSPGDMVDVAIAGDTITSGNTALDGYLQRAVLRLRGTAKVVSTGGEGDDGYIVIKVTDGQGGIPVAVSIDNRVTLTKKIPDVTHVIECNNRLWGCLDNEILASALGDFSSWRVYRGVSTDSYAVTVGTDGPFTGGINYMGQPIFFKEKYMHRVYGSYPSEFQLQTVPCQGVNRGAAGSMRIMGTKLLYLSTDGVYSYDGSFPVKISDALPKPDHEMGPGYAQGHAGIFGDNYYLSVTYFGGTDGETFVYNHKTGNWYRQDEQYLWKYFTCQEGLFAVDPWAESGLVCLHYNTLPYGGTTEPPVEWMAETAQLGIGLPDAKYISMITVYIEAFELGSEIKIEICYDDYGGWQRVYTNTYKSLKRVAVPIRPRRCHFFRLRFSGKGDIKLYSITKSIANGGDR